jgi:hypothetical protein
MRFLVPILVAYGLFAGSHADAALHLISAEPAQPKWRLLVDHSDSSDGIVLAQSKRKKGKSKGSRRNSDTGEPMERGSGVGISKGKYIAGGIVGTAAGFGIGHAIQGRYGSKGWIFTVTEGIGLGLFYYSFYSLFTNPSMFAIQFYGGLAMFLGFHIWEIIDVWAAPKRQPDGTYLVADAGLHFSPTLLFANRTPAPGLLMSWVH